MSQRRESVRKKIAKVDLSVREQSGRRIDAKLKFITPTFGGGVRLNPDAPHQKEHDEVTPVRGAALRGQLRGWWRRTCAAGLGLEQTRERERVLWGWASTKERPARGLVSLSVQGKMVAEKVEVYDRNNVKKPLDGFGSPLSYAAFPLQPSNGFERFPPGTLTRWKGEFQVALALQPLTSSEAYEKSAQQAWRDVPPEKLEAKLWDEVERAWLAFVTFGGLGGRTRRGFGAVQVVGEGAVPMKTVAERLGWTARVSALKQPQVDAEAAQKVGIAKLQSFRQGVGKGRNPGVQGGNKPGRSRWPEPDEIRRLSRQSDPEHRKPIHDPAIRKFPRAAFGMPIIFHFQSRTDPGDHSLQPAGKERMASPIILRPVVDPDRKVHGVALLLPVEREIGRILNDLHLKAKSGDHSSLSGALTTPEVNAIKPLQEHLPPGPAGIGLSGARAVFEPFLQFFKS